MRLAISSPCVSRAKWPVSNRCVSAFGRSRRYETALMRERSNVRGASDDHKKILAALRARDLPRACEALRRNLQSGIEPVLAWLKTREKTSAGKRGADK